MIGSAAPSARHDTSRSGGSDDAALLLGMVIGGLLSTPLAAGTVVGAVLLSRHLSKQAARRKEEAMREMTSFMSRTCCAEGRSVEYDGWYGSVHTFYFENEQYAQAFIAMNRGKVLP
jgi:hypothetical protein